MSDSEHSVEVQIIVPFNGGGDSDSEISGTFLGDSDSDDLRNSSAGDSDSDCNSDELQPHFFEGVEKLLEVWFTRSDGKIANCDLRKIPRAKIESMLRIVKCEIIGSMSNDYLDSYVLSESSLFVSKRRIILKTCGTTTPLLCMSNLSMLVKQYAGFDKIEDVFYSRKNYKRPELQRTPHRNFNQEVELLEKLFTNSDGSAYTLGSLNRDCWHLYTLNPLGSRNTRGIGGTEPDQTLEVIMTDLNPEIMRIFTKEVCKSGEEATLKSGIDRIIPNAMISEHLFEPCGYSMNGIFKNDNEESDGSYMTIHITPEPAFSYVSFETNVSHCSYKEIITRVLDTFLPGKFVLTVFANKASNSYNSHAEIDRMAAIKEWLRMESQFCRFKNYDLTYARYTKFPS